MVKWEKNEILLMAFMVHGVAHIQVFMVNSVDSMISFLHSLQFLPVPVHWLRYCDTKPVYYISKIDDKNEWTTKSLANCIKVKCL